MVNIYCSVCPYEAGEITVVCAPSTAAIELVSKTPTQARVLESELRYPWIRVLSLQSISVLEKDD